MALHCDAKQVRYLAINKISSGGLNWNKVHQMISNVFMDMNIKIYMYK